MTEKSYAPTLQEKKTNLGKNSVADAPKDIKVSEDKNKEENKTKIGKKDSKEKTEKKEAPKKKIAAPKRDEVFVKIDGLRISTKKAAAVCKFIKWKSIPSAIADLKQVVDLRKAVPMKGEIPHRKGKMMSGRFPKRTAEEFITALKSLQGNANNHGIDEPVINFAVANMGSRPFGRFGAFKRKRTHLTIKAIEKNKLKKNK